MTVVQDLIDKVKLLTVSYTTGRSGNKIEYVVVHHNAGNLTTEGCYNLWTTTRAASAHLQVEADGTVGQLVLFANTAWHAGNWTANTKSIGIEHANSTGSSGGWKISDATLDKGAQLVAAICYTYGLGRPKYGSNVFYHSDFVATTCPGGIRDSQWDSYIAKAQSYYDEYAGTTSSSSSSSSSSSGSSSSNTSTSTYNLTVDGLWGTATTTALQTYFGTTVDGEVSSQSNAWKSSNPGLTTGWEWVSSTNAVGSKLIIAMQKKLGVTADGLIGSNTIKAIQSKIAAGTADGVFDSPSPAIKQMQTNLNTKGKPW